MSSPGIRAAFGIWPDFNERHIAELSEALGRAGLEQIDLWS